MNFPVRLLLSLSAAAAVAGCTSPQARRSAEFPNVLAPLSDAVKDKVLNGVVEEGYTSDMVYIAVGKPSEVAAGEEQGRHVEVWSYKNFTPISYVPPRGKGGFGQSKSLGAWGNASLPSGPSVKGDEVATPRTSGGMGGAMVESSVCTLRLLLADGKVVAVRYER